ncbi:TolC family protein [Labilibaculum sp. DW002]|uniref:TolC family protein n=1 Tax=Paralabilibaculum antarcticum TaxID=2912572 RepID=A0ABT5VMD4_9BACT|nr:TolC family protein [Labilibaculum sp. DW002]MDE5416600.1 TolC family protein [Labilibaculum sp. DW002]
MRYNIFKTAFLLTIGLLVTKQIVAQEVLSLQVCKEKALEHNQTVKSAVSDFKSSEASLKLSKRAMLPTFDLTSNYTYLSDPNQMVIPGYELPTINGQPSGVYSPGSITDLAYTNSYSANLGMSLPIYMGGKLQHVKTLSKLGVQLADDNLDRTKSDLFLDIETKYWGLVSLQEQKMVIEKSIELLTDVLKEVNNRYKTGIVTKNELLKTKVELNNAKLSLIELNDNIELSKMSLNQSIGEEIMSTLQIQDSIIIIPNHLSDISFDEKQLLGRSEVKMLNTQLEMSKTQKKLVSADYLPQLVSFANYVSQNPDHYGKQKNDFTFNAGVSLSIPVFHWGEKKLKKHIEQRNIEKAEYELDQSTELMTLEIHQAIFKLKESLIKLDFTETSLEQANENLKLERNRLKQGVSTTRELLNAQLQWQQSHANFINAKTKVKTSIAKYYKSIGQLNS